MTMALRAKDGMTSSLIAAVLAAMAIAAAFLIGAVFGPSLAVEQFETTAARLEPAMSISQQFVGSPKEVVFHSYRMGATYQCTRQEARRERAND